VKKSEKKSEKKVKTRICAQASMSNKGMEEKGARGYLLWRNEGMKE